MSLDDVGWAFLFLVVVGLIVAVGVVVGIIAAGRIDRLMAPRPTPNPDEQPTTMPAPPTQEDQP